MLTVNQRLAQVTDEDALANLTLQLPGEVAPAIVSSAMVRFDDHHQPMPIAYRGALDETMAANWHRHLSSQPVRARCQKCRLQSAKIGQPCPMLQQLPLDNISGIVCQPLVRNSREFAVLGMFLAADSALLEEEEQLLVAISAARVQCKYRQSFASAAADRPAWSWRPGRSPLSRDSFTRTL